jgi:two-component system cell cycle sensor histidine kinase/response regulator CckA
MNRAVLLVDDDSLVRLVLSDMLTGLGFDVTEAANPAEGFVALEQAGEWDVLVTDILMPGMDGWTFAERVRANFPDLPVLYITGYSEEAERPVTRSRVIRKPFSEKTFVRALTDLLL